MSSDKTGTAKLPAKANTKIIVRPKMDEEEGGSDKKAAIFAVLIFVLVAGLGANYYFSNNKVAVFAKEIRKPAEVVEKYEEAPIDPEIYKASLRLANFDKQSMQAFIDGRLMNFDLMGVMKAPLGLDFTLRIQIVGKGHFVKEMKIEDATEVEVQIPETPATIYGYVNTVGKCVKGDIRFEIFGEKRTSHIPMKDSFGVGIPLEVNDKGESQPTNYQFFFNKKGDAEEKPVNVTIQREDQVINLCQFL